MSLALRAVRGAVWTIGASILARAAGLIGTLLLTHLLAPEVFGEVAVAYVVVFTANQLSIIGFGQYVIAKPEADRATVFHATFFNLLFALAAFAAVLLAADSLAGTFGAPDMAEYVPGLVLAAFIQRIGFLPQRLLARDMRFGIAALGQGAGELSYVGIALVLANAGWGGDAIVWGNVARALASSIIFLLAVSPRQWLTPHPLSAPTTRDLFRFGVPISAAAVLGFASRRWDNLLFSAVFGPATMGLYNMAYNLADVPATHVGEHIGDVLLPSFARLPEADRAPGLIRATGLLALIVFPLAVGLGAVAESLVASVFSEEWQGLAPFLLVLSMLSVARPLGWTVTSYLQARDRARSVLLLQAGKVVTLLCGVYALGQIGPLWACAGVGLAFVVHSLACMWLVGRADDVPASAFLGPLVRPLLACGVMVVAVLLARHGVSAAGGPTWVSLLVEIAAGAVTYVGAVFALMPDRARGVLDLLSRAFRGSPAEPRAATGAS